MSPVMWLTYLLYSISTWAVLAWLVLGILAVAACVRSSQLSRKLRTTNHILGDWRRWYRKELDRQHAEANSVGPEVTARTLAEQPPHEDT